MNSPTDVFILKRKDSNKAAEQLIVWKAGKRWRNEHWVDNVTGRIVPAEYQSQPPLQPVPVIIMVCVKGIDTDYAMYVNFLTTHTVKTVQICSWWYEDIARMDTAKGFSESPHADISVVNESSQ